MGKSVREAFRKDGTALIKNCLDDAQLAQCREAFDWAVANPGPNATSSRNFTSSSQWRPGGRPLFEAVVHA
ncbi:hypothetical protein ACWFR5_12420 [Streptomyces sp. NPDC055092]